MLRPVSRLFGTLFVILLAPAMAYAQGSIAGAAKDSSGAVLPGVTVEAASPVLIEKVRTVVTDGTGQYSIVDLRPGTYSVTFTLPGFNTLKREGVELTGSFTAKVDAELRVGAVEETVTVTGETPTVDVQSSTRQRVLDADVIAAVPTGRVHYNLAVLVPAVGMVQGSAAPVSTQDVGGSQGLQTFEMSVHGSHGDAQRLTMNGVSIGGIVGAGTRAGAMPSATAVQEMAINTAAVSAEWATGGVQINFIPREGGNAFKGLVFVNGANRSMQGDNFTQDLRDRGLLTRTVMDNIWDVNPGFGGPLRRDRIWFFVTARRNHVASGSGALTDLNRNNLAKWTYSPDPSNPALNIGDNKVIDLRLTWQATPRNKLAGTYDQQDLCRCPNGTGLQSSVESIRDRRFPLQRSFQADWSSPVTSRFLLEASAFQRNETYHDTPGGSTHGDLLSPEMIGVNEQSTGVNYRGPSNVYSHARSHSMFLRAAASYITGAHALKVGINDGFGLNGPNASFFPKYPLTYRFNNGIPNRITEFATPYEDRENLDYDFGAFVQDRWTFNRLTVTGGIRYDAYANSYPAAHFGPGLLVPNRNIDFPETENISWQDVTPRLGAAIDVFGNGKTAVKASLNKYLQGLATGQLSKSPSNITVNSTTRSWNDLTFPVGDPRRGNFAPDCDLTSTGANGECGAMANAAFGSPSISTIYDSNLTSGWGKRNYNWEFSAGVQQEIVPRVSAEVSYFRRWFGNFYATDNTLTAPSDFSQFSVTAPVDTRLPNGGGNLIAGLYDLNPNKVGQVSNFVTLSDNYGNQIEHWNGVDLTMVARLRQGITMQGGLSTGRTSTDNCEVVAKLDNPSPLYCHADTKFITQVKLLGVYVVPRIDVQFSATFQSIPGLPLRADYVATNAQVTPSLGRALSGGASNVTVNLVSPGSLYGERLNQLDFRFGKILKFGRARATASVDLYNALNVSTVMIENSSYASWRVPVLAIDARLAKVSFQIDF